MTPLTAAIVWAVVATVLGLGGCALSEYQRWWKKRWASNADEALDLASIAADRSNTWRAIAIDAEDRLRTIKRKRSDATRRGNETRKARQQALCDATTAKLRGVA